MANTNLQIRIPEEINSAIESFAFTSKSEFVRQAIEEKLKREKFKKLATQWIEALKKNPEDQKEAAQWHRAESWEE